MNGGEPLAGRHDVRSRYVGGEISLAHAVRGPITLITVGVLFALNNFTRYGFDQTWPVLLIVFGLLSLIGRGAHPPQRPAPPIPPRQPYPAPNAPPPSSGTNYRQSQYGTEKGDAQ